MLGLGLGLHKNTFVGGGIDPNKAIINAFKARVLADGGTFEAEQCLKDSLPALIENEPSLAVTPNAKEVGKLFSIIPTDGTGDLDVVRATTATYVGNDGLIKTALANEVRFDYSNGSCPSILVEPQRTNLVFPSATATTQTRTVTAVAHTLSFYGTGSVTLSGVATGTLNGTGANNKVTLTFTPTAGSLILTVVGSVTNWQLEAGSNATSYIPTVGSAVTRNADVISKSGISSLIGQTEGTMFADVDIRNLLGSSICAISDNQPNNRIDFYKTIDGRIGFDRVSPTQSGGNSFFTNVLSPGRYKIALAYKSGDTCFFVNGIQVSPTYTSTFTFNQLNIFRLGLNWSGGLSGAFNDRINSCILFQNRLSNTELAQLTTL